jgi:flagellar motor switch/type III secretory pathway protein FliN
VAETAPISGSPIESEFPDALWEEAAWLPCHISCEVPVDVFSVRSLLELTVGSLVETECKSGEDVPLHVNGKQIGWVEFEQMGQLLGVRLTELL